MNSIWLGIDFSGNWKMWSAGRATSNVWIATVDRGLDGLRLTDLQRVQELAVEGVPFENLVRLLAAGEYEAVGIDAPFSVPARRVPGAEHAQLLRRALAWDCVGRPFAPKERSRSTDEIPIVSPTVWSEQSGLRRVLRVDHS